MPKLRPHPFMIRNYRWYGRIKVDGKWTMLSLNIAAKEKNNNLPEISNFDLLRKLTNALEEKKNEQAFKHENVPIPNAFNSVITDKEDRRNWKTANRYRQVLSQFQEFLESRRVFYLSQIKRVHLIDYSHYLRHDRKRKPAGIRSDFAHIKATFNFVVDKMPSDYDPRRWFNEDVVYKAPPKRERVYSDIELRALFSDPNYGDIFEFLYLSGQRVGVVLQLHTSHIDYENGVICLPRGKKGQLHDLPITEQIGIFLERHSIKNGYLFWRWSGDPQEERRLRNASVNLQRRLKSILKSHGFKPGRVHDIRATTATRLAHFLTPFQLQAFIGWKETSTVQRYVRINATELSIPALSGVTLSRAEKTSLQNS